MSFKRKHQEILKAVRDHDLLDPERLSKFHSRVCFNVRALIRDFSFDQKRVLDLGCSFGNSLLYWGAGSTGVEVNPEARAFLAHFGVETFGFNVEDGLDPAGDGYQAVYSNNLIEHLVAPHLFLVRARALLVSGGLLALGHPVSPVFPVDWIYARLGCDAWRYSEHINFFTVKSITNALERSGFKVVRRYLKPFALIGMDGIPFARRLLWPFTATLLTVCEKQDDFKYPNERLAHFEPSWAGELKELHDK